MSQLSVLTRRSVLASIFTSLASFTLLSACANAIEPVEHYPRGNVSSVTGALANLQVRDRDTGAVLPIYRHEGRLYVAGKPGHRYSLSLRNTLETRGLFVVSVDGVNALTGETADFSQGGYVIAPQQSFDVNGWRKSTREVATFTFTSLSNSYAARTGRPTDVGAIGVALFSEREYRPRPMPHWHRPSTLPAPYENEQRSERSADSDQGVAKAAAPNSPGAPKAIAQEKLGTGHGPRETSVVERTGFDRANSTPDEVITIYYDSRENLIAQGVIMRPDPRLPRPFPAQPLADTRGFAPDPWR